MSERGIYYAYIISCAHLCPHNPELRNIGLTQTNLIEVNCILDGQTQVDSKPAGQPEHASLNQCQLIAAYKPELVRWAPPSWWCG